MRGVGITIWYAITSVILYIVIALESWRFRWKLDVITL